MNGCATGSDPAQLRREFQLPQKMGVEIYGNRTVMMLLHKDRSNADRPLSGSRSTRQGGRFVRVRRSSDCVLETPLTVKTSEG